MYITHSATCKLVCLMFCLVFFVFLENVSLVWWRHHYGWRATHVPSFYRAFRVKLSCRSRSVATGDSTQIPSLRGEHSTEPPRRLIEQLNLNMNINLLPQHNHHVYKKKLRERVKTNIKPGRCLYEKILKHFSKENGTVPGRFCRSRRTPSWIVIIIWYMFESGRFCKAQLLSNHNRYLLEAGMWQNLQWYGTSCPQVQCRLRGTPV